MGYGRLALAPTGHPRLSISSRSGAISVTAEERPDFLFEASSNGIESAVLDAEGRATVRLDRSSRELHVRCPLGSDVIIGTHSGRVALRGEFGKVSVTTASASIEVDRADVADLRSEAGNISVGGCGERCRVQTKSGRATIGPSDATDVATLSGNVSLAAAGGPVRVRTASGSVAVRITGKNDVAVQTMSGSVRVAVPAGVRPDAVVHSKSGHSGIACECGSDCCVVVKTLSGAIEVVPG